MLTEESKMLKVPHGEGIKQLQGGRTWGREWRGGNRSKLEAKARRKTTAAVRGKGLCVHPNRKRAKACASFI